MLCKREEECESCLSLSLACAGTESLALHTSRCPESSLLIHRVVPLGWQGCVGPCRGAVSARGYPRILPRDQQMRWYPPRVLVSTPSPQPPGETGDQEGNLDALPLPSLLFVPSAKLFVDLGVKLPY